ncbi:MAG: hypothetical protein K6B51_05245 [Bacilli bacterium]|nr:hypothetical protein [Bacilli bacterium]
MNARKINLSGDVVYASSDESVLAVSEDGLLIGLSAGKAIISASCGEKKSNITIEVELGTPETSYTYYELDHTKARRNSLKAEGKIKILVVPVHIDGFEANRTASNIAKIKDAFMGKETAYESVTSFYKKSSYGKLDLQFDVLDDWYDSGLTLEEIYARRNGDDCGTSWLAEDVVSYLRRSKDTSLQDYDGDKDGYLDSLWMVYDAPNRQNADYPSTNPSIDPTLAWAFVTTSYLNSTGSLSFPVPKVYGWASFDFINDSGEDKVDAHTMIHETGHMFGLNDYYSYGNSFKTPLGCVDMMDNNIGDHNPFSKYALGWVEPKVVETETTIELSSFTETGDCLLIPSYNWNGTAFDEYFMVEFVTPTGLNANDYSAPYSGNNLQGYSERGVRILHVDSRLARAGRGEVLWVDDEMLNYDGVMVFSTPISNTEEIGYTFPYDLQKQEIPMRQVSLMQADFDSTKTNVLSDSRAYYKGLRSGSLDADDALFHEGDTFYLGQGSPYNALMPSASARLDKYAANADPHYLFDYKITVEKIDEAKALINIKK